MFFYIFLYHILELIDIFIYLPFDINRRYQAMHGYDQFASGESKQLIARKLPLL